VPRLLAILLGAAEGVIIAAMILLPVTSAVDLIDDSVTALCEGGERPELQEAYDEYISPVSKNPVFSIIKFAGGDLLLDKMSKQKYSYSTVSKTKVVFGLVLKYAILYEGLPLTDFMSVIRVPKNTPKGKVNAPDDDVIKTIFNSADTVDFGLWALSLLCTGFRRGELDALQKRDIDFDSMQIPLYRSVEFVNNQPILKDAPKTESGIRKQPILDIFYPYLQKICENLEEDDFLFGGKKPLYSIIVTAVAAPFLIVAEILLIGSFISTGSIASLIFGIVTLLALGAAWFFYYAFPVIRGNRPAIFYEEEYVFEDAEEA
jgi:hypothetical protein